MSAARLALMHSTEAETVYLFQCPGCGNAHWVRVRGKRPLWSWNGRTDLPTFTPSLNVAPGTPHHCHSLVRDGRIQFLPDCSHKLAGQTVDIPLWEEGGAD